jgi:hypothetical protein
MALKNLFSSALLAAVLSLTLAQAQTPDQDEVAPGIWPTFNNEVHDVLPLPDDSFIVGGAFTSVTINGTTTNRSRLVHINANGTLDTSFPTADSTVYALAADASGRIYIGGDFSKITVNSVDSPRIRVARLTSTFAVDAAFSKTATAGPLDDVYTLAPTGDGSVYIGGHFDGVGTVTAPATYSAHRMAKLKADGSLDTGFKSGASNDVNDILRLSNGTMYVAGITNVWGLPPGVPPTKPNPQFSRIAKVSASGGLVATFKAADVNNLSNIFYSVIQLADGSILAGANTGVKRLDANTGATLAFNLPDHFLAFGAIAALAQQRDGKLLSGGYGTCFLTNSAGVKDANFNISSRFSQSIINTIKIDRNGRIFIGGNFTYNDGVNPARSKFVVLNGTNPRTQAITLPAPANPTFTAGQNVFTLNATASSGLPVTLALTSGNATLAGNKLTILGAGDIVITASQAGNDDFDPATLPVTITVPKQAQTITFPPMIDRPLGSAPFFLAASTSSGLPVRYEVVQGGVTLSGNQLTLTGTGTVKILASHPGNDDYLPAADVEQEFDVFEGNASALLPQTIVFNLLPPRAANEQAFSIDATATSGLSVTLEVTAGGNIASISENMVTLSGQVGTVTITATQAGNGNYLAAKPVTQTFKVGPAATTLTLTNLIQTYDGDPKPVGTVGGEADTIYYTVNKVKGTTPPTAAGSYPVEAVAGSVKKTGTLVINKAPLLVVASDQRRYVGQANPLLTFAYSGFLESDHAGNALTKVPTVTTKATPTSPGGNYPITPAGGAANNYALVYVSGNMRVETFAGQYEALIISDEDDPPAGKLEISVLANSVGFTAKFTSANGAAVSFKGNLVVNYLEEEAGVTVTGKVGTGAAMVTYDLALSIPLGEDFTAIMHRATGSPAGPATYFGSSGTGKKLYLPSGTPPVSYAGAYTLLLDRPVHMTDSTLPLPQAHSYASAIIDAKGKLTLTGVLADGTKLTASLLPDETTGYRLYALPYGTRLNSYLTGWLNLAAHPDLAGRGHIQPGTQTLYWAKAAGTKDPNFRDGFPQTTNNIRFDAWLPPVTKPAEVKLRQRLGLNDTGDMMVEYSLNGALTLTGLPEAVMMDAAGKVVVPVTVPANPRAWKVTVTPATGVFTGSHTALYQDKSYTVTISGIMRQPSSTDDRPEIIGGGLEITPQLPGQTTGTNPSEIRFLNPLQQ